MSEKPDRLSRDTFADRVYEDLRRAIIRGELADGTELNQVDLASRFGVSRVPVREALRRLQAERFVVAAPYQRYVVGSVGPAEVIELMELREEIEVYALRRTFKRIQDGSLALEMLHGVNDSLEPDGDGEAWLAGDRRLHRLLLGENSAAATLVDDLRERVHRYINDFLSASERRQLAVAEHRAVLDALSAGDLPAAEAALRRHIGGTRRLLQHKLAEAAGAAGGIDMGEPEAVTDEAADIGVKP